MNEKLNTAEREARIKSIPKFKLEYGTIEHQLTRLRYLVKSIPDEKDATRILAQAEIEELEKQQAENAIPIPVRKSFLQNLRQVFTFDLKAIYHGCKLSWELYKNRKPGKKLKERYKFDNFDVPAEVS